MERLSVDYESNVVKAIFDNNFKDEDFKKFANDILNKVQTSGKKKLLYDTRGLKVMSQEIQSWINEFWFPKAISMGISHMAFVVPENIFGEVSMKETNRKKEKEMGIDIKYFKCTNEAQEWVKNK